MDDDSQLLSPLELQYLQERQLPDFTLPSPRDHDAKKDKAKKHHRAHKLPVKLIAIIKKGDETNDDDEHGLGGSMGRYKRSRKAANALTPSGHKKTLMLISDDEWSDSDSDQQSDSDSTSTSYDSQEWDRSCSTEYWIDPSWVVDENEQELIEEWEKRKRRREERARRKETETGEISETSTETQILPKPSPPMIKKKKKNRRPGSGDLPPSSGLGVGTGRRGSSVIILSPVGLSKHRINGKARGSVAFYEELTLGQHILRNTASPRLRRAFEQANTTNSTSNTNSSGGKISPRSRTSPTTTSITTVRFTETTQKVTTTSTSTHSHETSNEQQVIECTETQHQTTKKQEKTQKHKQKTHFGHTVAVPLIEGNDDSDDDDRLSALKDEATRRALEHLKAWHAEKSAWVHERSEWDSERASLIEEIERLRSQLKQQHEIQQQLQQQIRYIGAGGHTAPVMSSLTPSHPEMGPQPKSPRTVSIHEPSNTYAKGRKDVGAKHSIRHSTPMPPPKPVYEDNSEESPSSIARRTAMSMSTRKRMLMNLRNIQVTPVPAQVEEVTQVESSPRSMRRKRSNSTKIDSSPKLVTPRGRAWGSVILPDRVPIGDAPYPSAAHSNSSTPPVASRGSHGGTGSYVSTSVPRRASAFDNNSNKKMPRRSGSVVFGSPVQVRLPSK
eukprot:TRINITY_DN5481_c0_g1_i1.p1 TRINITY_DN5481_c0_g1~~TRINITY_DN5481_c0_g1_i1.p1  ORF type:complete len:671 (+),score=145.58 TRINITY_DN5481_c0_g1_i1:174-2186(+)